MEGDHVFALPYASCLSTFQAPGWGIPAVFLPHRWRNATPWELVPFSHRSASRIFITQPGRTPPPVVTRDGDLRLIVGGTQLRGSWYLSAIVRLQGFSSRSPAAPLHRWSPGMATSGLMVGKASQAAASTPPSASRIFVIQAKMKDEASRGAAPAWVGCLSFGFKDFHHAACPHPATGGHSRW